MTLPSHSHVSALLRRPLLGLLFVASAAVALADPNGIWKLNVEGPDGRTLESTLTLAVNNGRLTGTMDNRLGPAEISAGTVNGDQVTFSVVREIGRRWRKKTFVSEYVATVKNDTLEGQVQMTDRNGQPRTVPFTAVRVE